MMIQNHNSCYADLIVIPMKMGIYINNLYRSPHARG